MSAWAVENIDNAAAVVKKWIAEGLVDPERVYVIGFSAGGGATWTFLSRHPDIAAAAVPMCSGATFSEETVKALTDVAIWHFVTKGDSGFIYDGCLAVEANYGPKWPKYMLTVFEDNKVEMYPYNGFIFHPHAVWVPVVNEYNDPERGMVKDWLFAQSKASASPAVSITSPVSKIVADYAANIPADVKFTGEVAPFALGLYDAEGTLVDSINVCADGRYTFKITAFDTLVVGTYVIKAVGAANGAMIDCVTQPTDLWKPLATCDDNSVTVVFASNVTFNAAKKGAKIGGEPITANKINASGQVVTLVDVAAVSGQTIEISGVKYADLFPSYSFTFTLQLPAEKTATLLYQGHGSLRVTTREGKVIYIDPYAGEGYDVPADMILVTHPHSDHTAVNLIETKNSDCVTITHEEALAEGIYKIYKTDYVTVEAVQAGNNPNHNINVCVGYILTFSDGKSVYISGDTSTTEQMATFAERNLDYAFFCCDGRYNMGLEEAAVCAKLVQAKYSIPYHIAPGKLFDRELAEQFNVENRLILADGEEISIK